MPVGEQMVVSGKMEWFNGRPSMVHPDHIARADEAENLPLVEPVYPLTAGLSAKCCAARSARRWRACRNCPNGWTSDVARRQSFPPFAEALRRLHNPADPIDVSPDSAAWRRLAYDEFLAGQVSLALVRAKVRRLAGRPLTGDGRIVAALRAALPYSLTGSQEQALAEINADLAKPERMLRLLQGDVGSGKTVVALLAMGRAVEAGGQAALMAPTEILARQHFATIAPLAEAAGLNSAVLTGREKGRERAEILAGLESGAIDIVIGTHALFQESVRFRDLGSRHRRRAAPLRRAPAPGDHRQGRRARHAGDDRDADPAHAGADRLRRHGRIEAHGKAGRPPADPDRDAAAGAARRTDRPHSDAVADGQKVYWICPLVEESEEIELMSAEERFATLQPIFGDAVGLVHGRMKGADKDEAMRAFKDGETRILVATTVIEVGVDVPDATIMVIEHAERFGLAQLHQLRGRVGRGDKASTCVLLYKAPLGETAARRLSVMRETEDGFLISEEDLKLRGEGELLGTRQSGTPGFQVARIEAHADLLEIARDDARLILSRDPDLQSERGEAVRMLLYLFGRDEAVRLLRAG